VFFINDEDTGDRQFVSVKINGNAARFYRRVLQKLDVAVAVFLTAVVGRTARLSSIKNVLMPAL
jgi:hypothetical protein